MEDKSKPVQKAFFSYLLYPDIDFEAYEEGEKIIFLLRSHPITQINWLLMVLISFFLLIVFNFSLASYLSFNQIFIFNFAIIVFILTFFWIKILNWYFNVGIITDKKIIDIDFHGIIYKEISMARLNKVEDITMKSSGYLGSLLNYGTIFIQTAGNEANIEFDDIPYPNEICQYINQLLSKKHGI